MQTHQREDSVVINLHQSYVAVIYLNIGIINIYDILIVSDLFATLEQNKQWSKHKPINT